MGAKAGKTIRTVFDPPEGSAGREFTQVVVFGDHSWAGIVAENDGDDRTDVDLSRHVRRDLAADDITQYLTPEQLLDAHLVNRAQYDLLIERERARKREEAEKEAERLRQQLAALAPSLSEEAKIKAIREAAELIEAEAANLARGHATDGNWGDDHEPKAAYDEMLAKASALRAFLPAIMQTETT